MLNKLIEFLQTIMGKTVIGLALFFMAGVIAYANLDKVVCTEHEEVEIYLAMEQGNAWNKLDIIQWKLDQANGELIRLQNYIEIEQKGNCTESQRIRIDALNKRIGELQAQKSQLLNTLQKKR